MKVNKSAMTRLIRAYIGGKRIAIPTKELFDGRRIHLVPIKSIVRNEVKYKDYKSITPFTPRTNQKGDMLDSPGNVNYIRAGIRRGDHIHPVKLHHITGPMRGHYEKYSNMKVEKHHHYILLNGHHRLTAHQAEGKRFIRAVFHNQAEAVSIPKTGSPKTSSGL